MPANDITMKTYDEEKENEFAEHAANEFAKVMDRQILAEVHKEAYLIFHAASVVDVFKTLYPETKITDEQIRLIVLMWEERVEGEINEN